MGKSHIYIFEYIIWKGVFFMKKDISVHEKSLKVRFLSALTSVMILVMTVVPMLDVSAIDVSNLSATSTTTDVELLAGDGNPLANGASSADDVISNADKTYYLVLQVNFAYFCKMILHQKTLMLKVVWL